MGTQAAVGALVRALTRRNNLTTERLAEVADIPADVAAAWRRGDVDPDDRWFLAGMLGIPSALLCPSHPAYDDPTDVDSALTRLRRQHGWGPEAASWATGIPTVRLLELEHGAEPTPVERVRLVAAVGDPAALDFDGELARRRARHLAAKATHTGDAAAEAVRQGDDFADTLSRQRKAARLRRSQVAEAVGVTQSTVGRWERGETVPAQTFLVPLSDALGCPATTLIDAHPST